MNISSYDWRWLKSKWIACFLCLAQGLWPPAVEHHRMTQHEAPQLITISTKLSSPPLPSPSFGGGGKKFDLHFEKFSPLGLAENQSEFQKFLETGCLTWDLLSLESRQKPANGICLGFVRCETAWSSCSSQEKQKAQWQSAAPELGHGYPSFYSLYTCSYCVV